MKCVADAFQSNFPLRFRDKRNGNKERFLLKLCGVSGRKNRNVRIFATGGKLPFPKILPRDSKAAPTDKSRMFYASLRGPTGPWQSAPPYKGTVAASRPPLHKRPPSAPAVAATYTSPRIPASLRGFRDSGMPWQSVYLFPAPRRDLTADS